MKKARNDHTRKNEVSIQFLSPSLGLHVLFCVFVLNALFLFLVLGNLA